MGVLAGQAAVRYATAPPRPSRRDDHEWVPLPDRRPLRVFAALRHALRRDVAFLSLHDPELMPVGLIVRVLRRIPVVFDVHEDLPGQMRDKEWLPRVLRPLAARAATFWLRLAERTLTITLAEDGYHRHLRSRHVVLPNYPDVDRLPAPAPDRRIIVYVGDIREVRGALVAVEAVGAMAHPLPLVMIGRCPEGLRRRLHQRAETLGVDLALPGFLPHAEAMALVAGSTVGLSPLLDVPNYRWSLPTKVLEYLALGVPVVASDLPGTAEVVHGIEAVRLVQPGNHVALAAALDAAVTDPDMRSAAQNRSRELRERFDWPAGRLLETYGLAPPASSR